MTHSSTEKQPTVAEIRDIEFSKEFEEEFAFEESEQKAAARTPWGAGYAKILAERDKIRRANNAVRKPPIGGSDAELEKLRDTWADKIEDLTGEIPLELPPLREINHRIPIVDPNKNYRTHPPRCADAHQRQLLEKINRYVQAGWWQPTTASRAAPMLCIPKKTGKLRTVIDLRERNDNTVHDITPMPDQDRIRNDVARAKFRSKLDMSDAYEQIRVIAKDIGKTAFATIFGTYLSLVMQQGDCNAPATFQRLMTHIFREYIGIFVHVYLDDIFIYSNSIEEHEQHLALVFEALRKAHMYLSKSKVDLYSKRMDCLGHIIDDAGIHAESDKMERIRKWRTPRNYNDVIQFLGLVQYLAQFMPNVAAYMSPLSTICANDAPFHWRPIHDKCFEMIKALAAKAPILKPIDPEKPDPIWVICDASTSGIGAYYGQGPDWKTCRPAGFMSKKFTNAQHAYVTYEHETIAILEALLKWEDKLLGRKIKVITDHKTLEFFNKQRHMSWRQIRWSQYLGRFDHEIIYVKGETNKVADALSRYYLTDRVDEVHPSHIYVNADVRLDPTGEFLSDERMGEVARIRAMRTAELLPEVTEARHAEAERLTPEAETGPSDQSEAVIDAEDPTAFDAASLEPLSPRVEGQDGFLTAVKSAYASDALFGKIIDKPNDHAAFELREGLIWTRNRAGRKVLAIPKSKLGDRSLTEIVIDTAHYALGHFGAQKTIDYIRRSYWWPQMAQNIDAFCASCHQCQMTKTSNSRPAGLLHSMPIANRPWGSIAMDFLGPFPKAKGFDYLWVVIDRLTSMVHLIPCTTKTRASELAYLFLKEIVRLHGLPDSIVSDRDSKFTSKFWKELHRLLGTKLLMSTAFHPQTDGVTERANRSVAQILRSMISPDQTDWVDMLPLTEFAINSCQSSSTGYAPFELNYGFMPKTMTEFNAQDTAPGIREFAYQARDNLLRAHDAIIASRVRQTHHANKRRSKSDIMAAGDKVYLSTEDLNLPLRRARKLAPKYIGPFTIVKAYNNSSTYELDLSTQLRERRIHPVFHVSRLRPHVANDDELFPGREIANIYDFGQPDESEQLVVDVVAHDWVARSTFYLVRWATGDSTWEPWAHVKDLEAIDRYFEMLGVERWQDLPKNQKHNLNPNRGTATPASKKCGAKKKQPGSLAKPPVQK